MPDTQLQVERNGVTVKIVEAEIKRGAYKGSKYLTPDLESLSFADRVKWIGEDDVNGKIVAFVNQKAQGWFEEACSNADGTDKEFDAVEYCEFAKSFSARGESIPQLKSEREELTDKLCTIFTRTDLNPQQKTEQATKLTEQIQSINAAIKQKRRKTKEDKEAEAAEEAKA